MTGETGIEQLEASDKAEALMVYIQAENLPTMAAALCPFGRYANFLAYGIRENGKCVSVAFLSDPEMRRVSSPMLSRIIDWLIGFLCSPVFRVARIFRSRTALEVERIRRASAESARTKERYLKLEALATLPSHQKRGLGRDMLRFISKAAASKGYEGIHLTTARDSAAFRLYVREGFTVEDLHAAPNSTVFMQLSFSANQSPTAYNNEQEG